VRFYAIGVIGSTVPGGLKSAQLAWLEALGFETVPARNVTADTVITAVEEIKNDIKSAPFATDGLVLTIDDINKGAAMGATSKFPRDSIAFKWADELQETTLLAVEWNTSRTGLINPVAVFAPVELEGTTVNRASLHNVSIVYELALCAGDRITVYKANMIIPQVAENLSAGAQGPGRPVSASAGTPRYPVEIPAHCPVCGAPTEIIPGPSGEALYCTGTSCAAQRLQSLAHFVSRGGMNIEGLSEQTLEKFIALGLVENYPDLFTLSRHGETITRTEGFGRKSYENLTAAVERSKDIALSNFINALGIRHVGPANAKLLCAHFYHDINKIIPACAREDYVNELKEIKGFGEAIAESLHRYFTNEKNLALMHEVLPLLRLQAPAESPAEGPLAGLTFVITGEVTRYQNRKALQTFIESNGGKVTGSVTAKTSYLINNNITSASGKNKKAAELGVPVLTENDFLALPMIQAR
jgi:DNA ligase (NAD+)